MTLPKLAAAALAFGLFGSAYAAETKTAGIAVSPQYDTTHVYVAPEDFDPFVKSLVDTFGGSTSPKGVFQVTPTPSQTMSQLVLTPVGTLSVFGFKTPVPFPFGAERTGYLVADLDKAVAEASAAGADIIVKSFPDPIGRDAIIQWPGGVDMQLYWHTTPPNYAALKTVPENRVYLSAERADVFIKDFLRFSKGKIESDQKAAPGAEIGKASETYRRVRLTSDFGRLTVLVTNGTVPWPWGREMTGYEVADLAATLDKAKQAGATVLVDSFASDGRTQAVIQFPGGYIAEIHAAAHP